MSKLKSLIITYHQLIKDFCQSSHKYHFHYQQLYSVFLPFYLLCCFFLTHFHHFSSKKNCPTQVHSFNVIEIVHFIHCCHVEINLLFKEKISSIGKWKTCTSNFQKTKLPQVHSKMEDLRLCVGLGWLKCRKCWCEIMVFCSSTIRISHQLTRPATRISPQPF